MALTGNENVYVRLGEKEPEVMGKAKHTSIKFD